MKRCWKSYSVSIGAGTFAHTVNCCAAKHVAVWNLNQVSSHCSLPLCVCCVFETKATGKSCGTDSCQKHLTVIMYLVLNYVSFHIQKHFTVAKWSVTPKFSSRTQGGHDPVLYRQHYIYLVDFERVREVRRERWGSWEESEGREWGIWKHLLCVYEIRKQQHS